MWSNNILLYLVSIFILQNILPVSKFILPPGQVHPRGASQPRLACPPGGNLSRVILPPTLVIFTPGGKLSRPVYLAPRPTQVKIYTCYFVIFHFRCLPSKRRNASFKPKFELLGSLAVNFLKYHASSLG